VLRGVRTLLAEAMPTIQSRGVTLVGVAVINLDNDDAIQLELPLDQDSGTELDTALDLIRERFGSSSLTRGSLLRHGEGFTVPMLPD
jgi:DNA polymerase-4